jgi:hypothetical protein
MLLFPSRFSHYKGNPNIPAMKQIELFNTRQDIKSISSPNWPLPQGSEAVKLYSTLPGEGMNHYHPQNFAVEVFRHAEEHLQALVGTVAKQ